MTLWMWCLKWGKEVHDNLKLSGVFYTNFGGMFTCILDSIYLNIFTLENKKKFIASKELVTLNIRFTLMKHKQVCIWLVFSGKTSKEKIMRQTCHCARFVIVRSLKSCLTLWPRWLQLTRLPCPSLFPGVCSYSCPLSWWCHPTISSSAIPFSSCLQSFPASGSFQMSCFTDTIKCHQKTKKIKKKINCMMTRLKPWYKLFQLKQYWTHG